ncbi:MAG: universal stress protein [Haloferacaceae archaeon]
MSDTAEESETVRRRRQELDTILVAVGQEDRERVVRLAEEAIAVAAAADAQVVLAHVFTEDEYDDVLDTLGIGAEAEVSTDGVAERHAATRDLTALLDEADVEYTVRGAVGDHAEGIVAIAENVGADRVIVGGRRRSPTGKAVFGSVAQEVLLSAPCPVTFVRGDTE